MKELIAIRMSGLGGQGVVTAAHILGAAAFRDNLQVTVNPFFGAEKRLAPAESYVRMSTQPIYERGEVLFPSIIMIFHPEVITLGKSYTMPFYDGLQPGGIVLINSEAPIDLPGEFREQLRSLRASIYYLSATELATKVSGTELSTNIAMVGGIYGIRKLTSLEALEASMVDRFGGTKFVASATTAALDDAVKAKFSKVSQMIEKNMEVIRKAGEAVYSYSLS